MSPRLSFGSLLALALLLPACRFGSAAVRGTGAFFSSPEKVEKPKEPFRKDARLAVTWIGHASALVQIDDKLILTDPVFTSTIAQLSKRIVEPGIEVDKLPPVDVVLISHMHYDHLSLGTLDDIQKKVRTLLLPRGGAAYITDFAFPIFELKAWQAWEKDGLRVTATPVDHLGFRYGIDDAWMKQSFTGYVIEYHGMKVYFGGDTAYDQKMFVETGQRFPNIDVALLPIGPIEPRDFMRHTHMDPREAVQCFSDLKATRMVPIHYDTFTSTDARGEALRELARVEKGVSLGEGRQILPLKIGEQRVFVKQGEDPAASRAKDAPAKGSVPPKPPPSKEPDIPDDQKLD